ncbi:hypothetical protein QJ48_15585 [Paenibacillus sp. A3]|nr:hypothetical protein QJ48_15585 [Paenibacillus sp. A3]
MFVHWVNIFLVLGVLTLLVGVQKNYTGLVFNKRLKGGKFGASFYRLFFIVFPFSFRCLALNLLSAGFHFLFFLLIKRTRTTINTISKIEKIICIGE